MRRQGTLQQQWNPIRMILPTLFIIIIICIPRLNDAFVHLPRFRGRAYASAVPSFPGNKPTISSSRRHAQQEQEQQGVEKIEIEISQYDFSSQKGWNDFYRQLENSKLYKRRRPQQQEEEREDDEEQEQEQEAEERVREYEIDKEETSRREDEPMRRRTFEFEWHSSIPHSSIIHEITIMGTAEDKNTRDSKLSAATRVLVVGTGNSRLPRELYDFATRGEIQVTCLDYSQPCIEMLKEMHASDCPNMNFICGDVTDLENVIRMSEDYYHECDDSTVQHGGDMQEEWKYDCIVDKGLMDALMCNDGWDGNNGSVPRYFQQARRVMKSHGKIILVTYKVNESKMEFLHMVGNDIGIQWMEIVEKSNNRVSFLVGTCI